MVEVQEAAGLDAHGCPSEGTVPSMIALLILLTLINILAWWIAVIMSENPE